MSKEGCEIFKNVGYTSDSMGATFEADALQPAGKAPAEGDVFVAERNSQVSGDVFVAERNSQVSRFDQISACYEKLENPM